ncbi:senescence-specific cysteine protease SAG12-like [Apium graveolens]|uniref:senescence-specific cysteine protease SAG12-like n=1 Tax=Apium graveolens TaxID=4045 RepID=UPI003D78DD6B
MASHNALCMILFLLFMGLLLPYEVSSSRSAPHPEKTMLERHEKWIFQHGRVYKDLAEKERRFRIFKDNVERIEAFNNGEDKGFKLAVNHFADLTDDEFRTFHATGYNRSVQTTPFSDATVMPENYGDYGRRYFRYANVQSVPESVDWRDRGVVTPVKYQGQCGSCFAFASVAAVESINAITSGQLVSLSEQEIVDCQQTSYHCGGGMMDNTYEFIRSNGLTTESNYPYQAQQGYCQNAASYPAVRINGYEDVPQNSETDMLKAVANQPISVAIAGGDYYFRYYNNGIMNMQCRTNTDHAVTIVGYGTTNNGRKYWIAKNSWGTGWGENGYIYLARDVADSGGLCGLATYPSYPTI